LVIIGTDRDHKTGAMRALLAKADGHALTYAGAAFIGLRGDAWHQLRERLQHIAVPHAPLTGLPPACAISPEQNISPSCSLKNAQNKLLQ
jgi:hypothetical protein